MGIDANNDKQISSGGKWIRFFIFLSLPPSNLPLLEDEAKVSKKSPSPHLAFSKADEEVDGCPHALKRLYVSVKCSPHVLSGIYTALVQNNDYHILLISTNKYWFCFDFALFIYFHIQAVFFSLTL